AAWLPRAQEAADQAIAVGDHGTAAALLQEILDQPGLTPDQLTRAAVSLAFAVSVGTQFTATAAAMRRILKLPGLPTPIRATIRIGLGVMAYQAGDLSADEEWLTALEEAGDSDPVAAAKLLGLLSLSETGRFTHAEQRDMVERGYALLAEHEDLRARTIVDVAHVSLLSTAADAAVPALLAALPRGDVDMSLRMVLVAYSVVHRMVAVGHDARAAAVVAEVRAMAPTLHLPVLGFYLDCHRIVLGWQAGRWEEAERGVENVRKRYPRSLVGSGGLLATVRGLTSAARGRTAQAVGDFDEDLALGLHLNALGAAAGRARLHLARNDPQAAWRALTDPLDFLAFVDRKE
ncbi:hypothetical protein ACWC5I_48765, partial [Kitasatospora sp. NPDC001574]